MQQEALVDDNVRRVSPVSRQAIAADPITRWHETMLSVAQALCGTRYMHPHHEADADTSLRLEAADIHTDRRGLPMISCPGIRGKADVPRSSRT